MLEVALESTTPQRCAISNTTQSRPRSSLSTRTGILYGFTHTKSMSAMPLSAMAERQLNGSRGSWNAVAQSEAVACRKKAYAVPMQYSCASAVFSSRYTATVTDGRAEADSDQDVGCSKGRRRTPW
eukprot:315777-Rhodomonas_salina.1